MKLIVILAILSVFGWTSASVFPNLEHSEKERDLSPKYRSFIHDTASSYAKKRMMGKKPKIVDAVANEIGHRLIMGAQIVLRMIEGSQGGTTEAPSTEIPTAPPTTDIPTEVPPAPTTTDTQPPIESDKKEYLSELLDILRDIKGNESAQRRRRSASMNPEPTVDELIKKYTLIQEIGHLILSMGAIDMGGSDNGYGRQSSEEY